MKKNKHLTLIKIGDTYVNPRYIIKIKVTTNYIYVYLNDDDDAIAIGQDSFGIENLLKSIDAKVVDMFGGVQMQKNKKVFASFKQGNKLSCFAVDSILGFKEGKYGNGRDYLRIITAKGNYNVEDIKAQELIDQMTNVEIRGAYAKKQRD